MLLQRLTLENYKTFAHAEFDLTSTLEKPLVLFTGNNGAGKTSTLEAFRLALYGRRSFVGMGEQEYQNAISAKFAGGSFAAPMSIGLSFEYADLGQNHIVQLRRTWRKRRKTIGEELTLSVDDCSLTQDLADDLLSKIVPPEVLRYFFFDAERIADITDWESDDDANLFASVNELLGLDLALQLERDLEHVIATSEKTAGPSLHDLDCSITEEESQFTVLKADLKRKRQELAVAVRRQDSSRRRFSALGGVFAEERARHETELQEFRSQMEAIEEAMRADAGAIMPLLIAPNVFDAMAVDVAKSEALEVLAVIQHAIAESSPILTKKVAAIVGASKTADVLEAVREGLLPKPVALDHEPLDLSLREASWMRNVLSRELPALRRRLRDMLERYEQLASNVEARLARLRLAPKDDRALTEAMHDLERATADVARCQDAIAAAQQKCDESSARLDMLRESLRKARHEEFRGRRLDLRDALVERVLEMLPEFADRMRESKEKRFELHLFESINRLWNKSGRLRKVAVNFAKQNIDLFDGDGSISKRELSAAEKQLFAIAFIFSLAKLSNRNLPFVIDTPLARLDSSHRVRLLSDFLPSSTHQAILFSMDTEVVGRLLSETRPFIARQYELADYNGGITEPVQLAIAL